MSTDDAPDVAKVRCGIIGVGIVGRQHAERLSAPGAPAALTCVADQDPRAAAEVAAAHGVDAAQTPTDLLARSDVDAVIIAVPSGLHADITVQALGAGKHVLLEKPIEVTVAAADRIREAEQRAGTVLTISSQRRFAAENQFLKQLITTGTLGRITSATVEVPLWRTQDYYDSGTWRGTWALDGGGALMNQGVHLVDLALWLLGEVEELYAHSALLAHERIEVEDTITLTARLRSGALLTFHATTSAYGDLPIRLSVMGDAGSIVTEKERIVRFHSRDDLALPEFEPVTQTLEQLKDFVQAIESGRRPLVRSAEARAAVAFIEAAYASARTGHPVRPQPLPGR